MPAPRGQGPGYFAFWFSVSISTQAAGPDEEGHHLRQAHLFLLTIGEAGHVLALDERLPVRGPDMAQRAGSVADKCNGFAGSEERFDQLDGVLVFREIQHRAMAARIEDGVVVFLSHAV